MMSNWYLSQPREERAYAPLLVSSSKWSEITSCAPAPIFRSPRICLTSDVNRSESRTGKRSRRASSEGSDVQPSIGIPLADFFIVVFIFYFLGGGEISGVDG